MALLAYAFTTVADVKTYLGISVSTYDTLLEDLINSLTVWMENYMGGRRIFDDGNPVTEIHDGGNLGDRKFSLYLKRWPINALTSIEYRSGDFDSPTWNSYDASNDYINKSLGGEVFFPGGIQEGMQNIRVIYKGGFTTIPQDLELVCKRMVGKEFGKRKSQGIISEAVGGGSKTWGKENVDSASMLTLDLYRAFHV